MKMNYWFWSWLVVATFKKDMLKGKNPRGEVWRNLVLISASDEREAVKKAIALGRQDEGDSDGSLRLDGKPAVSRFLGIESMGLVHDGLGDGAEILFRSNRELLLKARKNVKSAAKLAKALKKEMDPYRKTVAARK